MVSIRALDRVCPRLALGGQLPKLVKLIAIHGPLNMDDPQPAITVLLPDET